MKVLEKQDVSNWNYPCTCDNCDSKLEIESQDLQYRYAAGDGPYPGCESFYTYCVICKNQIPIPNDCVPKLIKVNLKKEYESRRSYWDR